jgi:hypothetical protein
MPAKETRLVSGVEPPFDLALSFTRRRNPCVALLWFAWKLTI